MHSTLIQAGDLLPGLPALSIITVTGAGILASCVVLYCLSRVRELLLIGAIAGLYAIVPVLAMIKHI